jgi:serine/threonine protein kinase
MVGRTVSHYTIEEKLGEGGMGAVYRARDTRLNRFVALKVLPADKVTDPGRKRRFVQEAKAASALNHPNIITIHDIDQADGIDFIAMEFVEGMTLDRLIPRNGLRLNEVLKHAIQLAAALARAHAAGIIHRDIKPPNIMVRSDGHLKVLDFGLAKLTEAIERDTVSLTVTMNARDSNGTEEGTILGTIAYMSPEQAEGKRVDARSDIFSFGSVLYEMVTGRRAFQEETKLSTLAAIVHRDPTPVHEIAPDAPRDLEKIIARCMRKDPERRFQGMADVKVALEELKEESDSGRLETAVEATHPRSATSTRLAGIALSVTIVAAGTGLWLSRRGATPPLKTPALIRLTSDSGLTTDPALSPDGKLLAYASDRSGDGNLDIWVQQVSGGDAIRLTHDQADDSEPVFSPDGSKIAFRSERDGGGIYVISALGGQSRRIVRQGSLPRFSPDGSQIAYVVGEPQLFAGTKSFVVASEGGQPRPLRSEFFSVIAPIWSPDGKRVLFVGTREAGSRQAAPPEYDWWVAPVEGGTAVKTGAFALRREHQLSSPEPLLLGPSLWLADTNSIVFSARSGDAVNLWQLDLSPKTFQATGALRQLTFGAGLEVHPSAAMGHIVFSSVSESTNVWGVPIDARTGKVTGNIARLTDRAYRDLAPSISTDGTKLAFTRGQELWLKELSSGKETQLSRSGGFAEISADGSKIIVDRLENQRNSMYVIPTNGGEEERACRDCRVPNGWSHDGKRILYELLAARAILLVDPTTGEKTEILKHPKYSLSRGRLSPDDHWIAFHSITPTTRRIFIAPYHGATLIPESQWLPITDGQDMDRYASWSPDGNLLYFISEREGFRCIWAQRLDPATKRPTAEPFPVQHFHTSRRSLMTIGNPIYMSLSVSVDKLVFSMVERTSNIWMTVAR